MADMERACVSEEIATSAYSMTVESSPPPLPSPSRHPPERTWADVVRVEWCKKPKEVMNKGEAAQKSEAEAVLKKVREERMRKPQVARKPEAVRKQVERRVNEWYYVSRAAGLKKWEVAKKTEAAQKKQDVEAAESAVVMKREVAKTYEAAESATVKKKQEVAKKTEAAEGAVVMMTRKKAQNSEAADSVAKTYEAAESATVKKHEVAKKTEAAEGADSVAKTYEAAESATVTMTRKEVRKRNKDKKKIELEKRRLRLEEMMKEEAENCPTEKLMDPLGYNARFHKEWFEETFGIRNFYENTCCLESGDKNYASMQIISVKVSELKGGLQWPLNVYGLIVMRDSEDFKRNIIFERVRENCQTLTLEDPYLVLTGPIRPVRVSDRVFFEVSLYVRGTDNSDDKELSLLAITMWYGILMASIRFEESYTSRLSTIDVKLAMISRSVEAAISVNIISGPPNGFFGEFVALNANIEDKVVLHKSGDNERHHAGDEVQLSRRLLSVDTGTNLIVSVKATDAAGVVTSSGSVSFDPPRKKGGISSGEISAHGVCKLKVTVVWSAFL